MPASPPTPPPQDLQSLPRRCSFSRLHPGRAGAQGTCLSPGGLTQSRHVPGPRRRPGDRFPQRLKATPLRSVLSLSPSEQNANVFNFSYFIVAAFNSCFIKSEQETAAPGMSLALNEGRSSGSGPHKQTVREPLGPSGAPGP